MIVRFVPAILGIAALLWVGSTFGTFWFVSGRDRIAQKIIAGESFADDVIADQVEKWGSPKNQPVSFSSLVRSEAVLRLRWAELALNDAAAKDIDARLMSATTAIKTSLAMSPADPFLWTALYWLETTRNGFSSENLRYLAYSYQQGEREGYVAMRRNKMALAAWPELDAAMQARVVAEFAGLVGSNLVPTAAENLAGVGWVVRDQLLAALADEDPAAKIALRKALSRQGLRISVPGLPDLEERPWGQ